MCKTGTVFVSFKDVSLLSSIIDLHKKNERVTYLGYDICT